MSLVKSGNGYVRVRFSACGPNSKLCSLVRYFASFDQVIWRLWSSLHNLGMGQMYTSGVERLLASSGLWTGGVESGGQYVRLGVVAVLEAEKDLAAKGALDDVN